MLMEGVVKGGYPVDITTQLPADLASSGQSDLGSGSALMESGLKPAAVAQLEVDYPTLDTQESYSREQDLPSSITEVIRPMEMAELVDILPTLSLIEEENPSCPSTPSVMDMLESFGLDIGERNSIFEFGNSDPVDGSSCPLSQEQYTPASYGTVNGTDGDAPVSTDVPQDEAETQKLPSKGACLPVRNQVEWERPSNSSS